MNYPDQIKLNTDVMYFDFASVDIYHEFDGALQAPVREFDNVLNDMVSLMKSRTITIPEGTVLYRTADSTACRLFVSDEKGFEIIVIDITKLPDYAYET
jgi:hypothetical protein